MCTAWLAVLLQAEDLDVQRLRDQLAAHTCSTSNHVDMEGLQRALEGLGVSMSIPELQRLIEVR